MLSSRFRRAQRRARGGGLQEMRLLRLVALGHVRARGMGAAGMRRAPRRRQKASRFRKFPAPRTPDGDHNGV
jgi:hypothetical protein